MKREKYRYDQWPKEGVSGLGRELALELATRGHLRAWHYVEGNFDLYPTAVYGGEPIRVGDPIMEISDELVLLFPDTLLKLEMTGSSPLRSISMEWQTTNDTPYVIERQMGKDYVTPDVDLPQLNRDSIVFFVADIERYTKTHDKPTQPEEVVTPNNLRDAELLDYLVEHKDKNIRSQTTLLEAKNLRQLFVEEKAQHPELKEKPVREQVLKSLRNPMSETTMRKKIASLKKAEEAVRPRK